MRTEPLDERERFEQTHPEGGFVLVEDSLYKAKRQVLESAYEAVSEEVRQEIRYEACDDCDRGYCDDCSSYGDGEAEGYSRGYEDAVSRRNNDMTGETYDEVVLKLAKYKEESGNEFDS